MDSTITTPCRRSWIRSRSTSNRNRDWTGGRMRRRSIHFTYLRRRRCNRSATMATVTFAAALDDFFADFFRLYPIHATEAGNHEHDGRWPDLTDAGRDERLAWLRDVRARLEAADGDGREHEI